MPELVRLGQQDTLSAYDAAYLDLAIETARPLLTTDRVLARAAVSAGVTLLRVPPGSEIRGATDRNERGIDRLRRSHR